MRLLTLILVAGCILLGGRAAPGQINMTPILADLPAPIISNGDTTASGIFIYPDALDLDQMATDDITPPSGLRWSYAIFGSPRYLINGVAPIDPAVTSPLNPPAASQINKKVSGGEMNPDGQAHTITIRNQGLSPLGHSTTTPTTPGIRPSETRVITFFCSDGNAYTSSSLFFYTDIGGSDRLSSPYISTDPFQVVLTDKITTMWNTNPSDWYPYPGNPGNNISRIRPGGMPNNGVCLNAPMTGDNVGSLITAMPYFNLAANQVYRFKMKMSNSNLTPVNMPYWDIVLENYETHTGRGLSLYIMDTFVFPNEGGANALTPVASSFTWYWTPPGVATPQWNNANTGAFTAARDAVNDPRLRFRVMDYSTATYAPAQGDLKSGEVCIQEVEVAAASLTRAQAVGNPLVNITNLADHGATGGNVECVPLIAEWSKVTFTGGVLTISPDGSSGYNGGQYNNLTEVRPATDATFSTDPNNPASQDNFPIAWKTGKILRLEVGMSAPTAADEANPWDAYVFLFNTMTNEINMESYQTSNKGIGSPKVGTPQTYTTFFYTGHETKSITAGFHRLRWLVRFVNTYNANFPNGQIFNTGSVRVHSIKVDEVEFK